MKRALILSVCAAALWAGACSGGGSAPPPPPPVIGFSNSSLQGQYAFSMTGTTADTVSGAAEPFARVGSFIADGKGNITGGAEDITISQNGSNEFDFTAGSYTVNGDGRGTLSLTDSSGTLTFSITLASSSNGYLVDTPADGQSAGNGSFVIQNTGSFQISGIAGPYAFDFSGVDPSSTTESVVGQLVSNSGGGFSGFADDNDGGMVNGGGAGGAPISGSYGVDGAAPGDLAAFGRGTFSLGGGAIRGVFYIVGPNQVKFLETTTGGTLVGDASSQSNIPTTAAGISGGFVYVMGGAGSGVPITRGGKFNTSSGALSTIIVDNNNAGQSISLTASSGTYTVDPSGNGRGTVTFKVSGFADSFSYVFYLISPTQAVIQDQSLNIVEDGSMLAQGTGTISNASLAGNYAINWSGVTSTKAGTGEEDLVGATALASGTLTGTIDLNESGATNTGVGMTGALALSGDGTGHNTLTVNLATAAAVPVTAFTYVAADNTILFMGTQTTRIIAGVLTPQTP